MNGPTVGYIISALTIAVSIYFGLRSGSRADKTETGKRLDKLENTVQVLRRRELWHEQCRGILVDELRDRGFTIPTMPEPPAAYPTDIA